MDFALSKEQRDIVRAARKFAQGEFPDRAQDFDREEIFDFDIWRKACELGFVGINLSAESGGGGMGIFELCLLVEEFWAVDAGIALSIISTTFGAELLDMFGTQEQKKKYITPIVTGKAIMGCAITEPDAGSDTASAATTAIRDGDEYIINGSKVFITNGTVADYLLVFCQTDPDNPDRHKRHTFIMVETNTKGFKAKKVKGKLGIRASDTAELSFSNVRVPASNLVGEEGNGFKEMMIFFDITRVMIASQAVGISRAALEEAISHITNRQQFGKALASFQANQFKIAEMGTKIRASRNLYYEAAWKIDNGMIDPQLIAMAKWFSGQVAVQCADEAVQMYGGYGYIDEFKVQRIYRDAKVLEIYEGTKEIEKIIIARSLLRK